MKMPFKIGNRHSLNLEQLRRQRWQDSTENITVITSYESNNNIGYYTFIALVCDARG